MSFTETPIENSPVALEEEVVEVLETQFEGWEPAEGDLSTWLIKAFTRISSIIRGQAAETSAAMFKKFGETIVSVPPILAAPASGTSTWKMVDTAGYTIPAGTLVTIAASGESLIAFEVVEEVVVASGGKETTAGQVVLRAVEPGTEGNGLTEDPELVDSLAYVEDIELVGATSGGVDIEDEDTYLDRLVEDLQLLSLSLITEEDFEKDARSVAGVARALAIGGYDGEAKTENNPLKVTVFPVDSNGAKLSTEAKTALKTRQQAKVPSGVIVYVIDPTYTEIDLAVNVKSLPSYAAASVKAAVEVRIAEYLSPARWGTQNILSTETGSTAWENATKLYLYEVIAEVDRVAGVDRVTSVLLSAGAGKAFTSAAATDLLTFASAHGYSASDAVVFRTPLTGTAPATAGTVYYVKEPAEKTFKISATAGGAAINITSDGSGTVVRLKAEDVSLTSPAPLPTLKTVVVSAE